MKRIAILGLSEDDFGVESNLLFEQKGPKVPKALLKRCALGITRAKVAVSAMTNLNDVIKNLRYNQHLTDRMSIGYINVSSKKVRTSMVDFEDVHENILKWASSCVVPFTGIVWVDANWEAVSRTQRRLVPSRPLLLQSIQQPLFRPLEDASSSSTANERRGSTSSIPPIVLSTSGAMMRGGGGGTRTRRKGNRENLNPFGPQHSERALRKSKKNAPGGIYSNNRNPGPYRLPDRQRGRATSLGIRPTIDHFITIAEKRSIGAGPTYMFSSFGNSTSSRPSSSMGFGTNSFNNVVRPPGPRPNSTAPNTQARRPSTVGSTSPRVPFGRSKRFHHPAPHSGISEVPVIINDAICMVRSKTPGPRYFSGCTTSTLGGRRQFGVRVSQSMPKQRTAPSAFMSTSPRFI